MASETPKGATAGADESGSHSPRPAEVTLRDILNRLIGSIFSPESNSGHQSSPVMQRIKVSLAENVTLLREASSNTGRNVLLWTDRGSPLRALLIVSVGTVILLAMTGLLLFILFFLAATANAVIIALLMTLAAAGGLLALFFACVTAIYICALSIAAFFISITTITAIVAVIITTGWIGFFWSIWVATKKSLGLAKRSLNMSRTALSARHHHHPPTKSD